MHTFKIGTLNARGLFTKIDGINELIIKYDLDFIFITETWWDKKRRPGRSFIHNTGPQEVLTGHPPYGTAIMINPSKSSRFPFEVIYGGEGGKLQVFRWAEMLFIGCHIPPSGDLDDHWCEILASWLSKAKDNEPVFVLGDLNMRLGAISGDTRSNSRAKTLLPILTSAGLSFAKNPQLPPHELPTCVHGVNGHSIVDYIFFSDGHAELVDYLVAQEDLGSDHLLVVTEFETKKSPQESIDYLTWNISKLKNEDTIKAYKEHFNDNYADTFNDWLSVNIDGQAGIDVTYEQSMVLIEKCAEEIIGKSNRSKWKIPLIHPRLPAIREACKQIRRLCQLGAPGADEAFAELTRLRNEAMIMAQNSIDQNWHNFVERTDRLDGIELMKMTKSFKAARTKGAGSQLETSEEALLRYSSHYSRQFSPPENAIEHTRQDCTPPPTESHLYFTPNMVHRCIKRYPDGKAGGPTGMKMELFKPLADSIAEPLAHFFNNLVRTGIVPTQWSRANIVPVPKKANSQDIKDHRPISLTEVLRKVFEMGLLFSLKGEIGQAHFAQGGFEAAKGTLDQVASLNEAFIIKRQKLKRNPCVAFLDIKAAYDSADRNVLNNRLLRLGAPKTLVRIVMALFDRNESRVSVGGRLSPAITHRAGLLQGSILSPTLYNCYIGEVMEKLMNANNGDALTSFWYADDSAVVGDDPEHLQRLLDVAQEHSLAINFRFNPTKCEVMNCESMVKLYGEGIPTCKQFKYLGVWFNEEGADWTMHFQKMVDKGRNVVQFWRSVGYNSRGFKLRTRRMIYTTFIRPVFEYGVAITPGNKSITNGLNRFQGEALCALFGVYKNTSRKAMETLLDLTDFEYRRKELQARWILRARIRDDTHMTRRAMKEKRRQVKGKSCFAGMESNEIVEYHDKRLQEEFELHQAMRTMVNVRFKARKINQSIIELRRKELTARAGDTKHCIKHPVSDDCKARWIYSLSRMGQIVGRFICNWLIGRYIGKPTKCLNCNEVEIHNKHIFECVGIGDIDGMCHQRKWKEATEELEKLFRNALSMKNLAEELLINIESGENEDELRVYR